MSNEALVVTGVKIKRAILLGAAQVTCAEAEEFKARTDEKIKALTETMFDYGAKLSRASELMNRAARCSDDEMSISVEDFAAIAEHIPET